MPILTCGNKKLSIPYLDTMDSEYIKDVVDISKNVDVIIPVSDKYCSVIKDYVDYLNGSEVLIVSKQSLILNFQLSTLFADDGYFKYCIEQVFDNWSDVYVMVYNDFNDDLQWSFFLHSPYDFIPKYLLDNDTFMTQWKAQNQNIIIKVNRGSAVYYTNVESTDDNGDKVIKTYHTVNGQEVGYKKVIKYYPNSNNIRSEGYYVDNKQDGIWREWYNNDQHRLLIEKHWVNGKRDGLWRTWYDNEQHTLMSEGYYVDGKEEGVCRNWYDTQGEINDQHRLEYEFYWSHDKKNGLIRHWYDNEQHTLEYEGYYVDDKQDGIWTYWSDDVQHSFILEQHWVHGVRQ